MLAQHKGDLILRWLRLRVVFSGFQNPFGDCFANLQVAHENIPSERGMSSLYVDSFQKNILSKAEPTCTLNDSPRMLIQCGIAGTVTNRKKHPMIHFR